jgi:hypothetical protein
MVRPFGFAKGPLDADEEAYDAPCELKPAGLASREIARRVGAVRLTIRRFVAGLTWPLLDMALRLDNARAHSNRNSSRKREASGRDSRLTARLAQCQRTNRPERLAPGRDQIGKVGDIVSESPRDFKSGHPGDFVGIGTRSSAAMKRRICEGL